jgi:hypothetical protein
VYETATNAGTVYVFTNDGRPGYANLVGGAGTYHSPLMIAQYALACSYVDLGISGQVSPLYTGLAGQYTSCAVS